MEIALHGERTDKPGLVLQGDVPGHVGLAAADVWDV